MSASFDLAITGVGAWAPGFADRASFVARAPRPGVTAPPAELLPARLRRRTSLLTRMAAEVLAQASAGLTIDLHVASIVFGSIYGEIQTTGDLLTAMIDDPGSPLSPTKFHNSVHNTAIGYLSIATKNHVGSTAVSAGGSTVAMALLEASTILAAEGGAVLVALAEEPLPPPLDAEGRWAPLAVGLVVERPGRGGLPIRFAESEGPFTAPRPLPPDLAANPLAPALWLVDALATGTGRVPLEAPTGAGARPWSATILSEEKAS